MPYDISWAYIAGFFDGEGHIQICKTRKHYHLRLEITQRNRDILEQIQKRTGGRIYQKVVGGRRPCHRLCMSGPPARNLLRHIAPRLVVKRREAQLALAFIKAKAKCSRKCSASQYRGAYYYKRIKEIRYE